MPEERKLSLGASTEAAVVLAMWSISIADFPCERQVKVA
jgi:hypothetical protein